VDQLDGADSSLRILGIDSHQHNFGALIQQLTQHGIAGPQGTRHGSIPFGPDWCSRPAIQYDGLFAVLGQEGDGDPGMTRFSVFIVMLRTSNVGAK